MRTEYLSYWKPTAAAPAVILNTTWAEVGYRVAFSPFELRAVGDGTLYSYAELPLVKAQVPQSLIEAAFVSARFPGAVPARSIRTSIHGGEREPVWNFVDGGYVDNSGSTTALELYKLLYAMNKAENLNIDLRLVLLTDADTQLDYKTIKGSRADDTVTPISALLSVRSQLSQRAVTQAIEAIQSIEESDPNVQARTRTGRRRGQVAQRSKKADDSHILIVDVEQQTFTLPLGWKISKVTNDIIRLMMGRPDLCPDQERPAGKVDQDIASVIGAVEQNSCVKLRITNLLKGQQ